MNLEAIHNDILAIRAMVQSAASRRLRKLLPAARAVAAKFNGPEMLVLLAARSSPAGNLVWLARQPK